MMAGDTNDAHLSVARLISLSRTLNRDLLATSTEFYNDLANDI